jgi:hypothetical protein
MLDFFLQTDSSSDSDDASLRNEIKQQHKIIREEKFQQRKLERQQEKLEGPKFMVALQIYKKLLYLFFKN